MASGAESFGAAPFHPVRWVPVALVIRNGSDNTWLVEPLLKVLLGGSSQNISFTLATTNVGTVQDDGVLSWNLLSLCLDHVLYDLHARLALDGLSRPCNTFSPQCVTQLLNETLGMKAGLAVLTRRPRAERDPAVASLVGLGEQFLEELLLLLDEWYLGRVLASTLVEIVGLVSEQVFNSACRSQKNGFCIFIDVSLEI